MITKQTGLFGLREEFKPLVTELGRIVKITENGYEMLTKAGMKQVKGTFNLGDFVRFTEDSDGIQIVSTLPAHSVLHLKDDVVTNVDTVIVVIDSKTSTTLELDHVLSAIWDSGALPVIAVVDEQLVDPELLSTVRRQASFVDVFVIDSNSDGERLRQMLRPDRTVLLFGSTNRIKEFLLEKIFQGSFTLTERTLFEYEEMAFITINGKKVEDDFDSVFSELDILSARCRFGDCTHTNEPGCLILEALEHGDITEELYNEYLQHLDSTATEEVVTYSDEDDFYYYRRQERKKNKFNKKNNKNKEDRLFY